MQDLVAFLSTTNLFAGLPEPYLERVAIRMEVLVVRSGQILMRQGEAGDCLYLILSGTLAFHPAVAGRNKRAAELATGQCVGELGVLTGSSCSCDVYALEDSRLARLSTAALEWLARSYPDETQQMKSRILQSVRKAQISTALRVSELFGPLDDNVLADLEAELETTTLASGEILLRQGDAGDALYLVVSGRLNVSVERDRSEFLVGEVGQGETVGEMALLSREPRTATIRAARDTQLAKLSHSGFKRLLTQHPLETVPLFTRSLVARIRQQNTSASRPHRERRTIAVIACAADVPLADFCARLSEALSRLAPVLHLSSRIVDGYLGKQGSSQASQDDYSHGPLVEWLANQEIQNRHVIYETDLAGTPWTRRSVRQADYLLFVANTTGNPALGEIEARIVQQLAPTTPASLILLHETPGGVPEGSARWLEQRQVEKHYHVRRFLDSDLDRLARWVAGRAVGLVLGGGFARGLAHIGLIRALRELQVPVDFIGGTSMGAIIGGQCAVEFAPERIAEIMLRRSREALRRDYTLPLLSLLTGRRIAAIMREIADSTGVHEIEDMWLPFFCVSSNLSRAEMKVHTRGSAVSSILASTRVPGLFPPVTWEDQLLVDGGLVNNVPVDVMRQFMNEGTIIASDVAPPVDFQANVDFGFGVSGWNLLWRRLRRASPHRNIVGVRDVLIRTIEFGGAFHAKRMKDLADLYLNMPVAQFKAGDFSRGPEIIDISYRFARDQINGWIEAKGRPWQDQGSL